MFHRALSGIVLFASAFVATAARAEFVPLSLGRFANANLQGANTAFPSGTPVVLACVPFDIPAGVDNYVETSAFQGTVALTFPIGLRDVAGVHTLINTYWGESGPGVLASLTFDFDDGSSVVKELDGNADIRDYYQNFFTNSINGTTTINVVNTDNDGPPGPNSYRLDKQFVDLSDFADRTLVSMTLTDWGATNVQRTFLCGITVQTGAGDCVPADLNCDGTVDGADITIVLGAWGTPDADLNCDGTTDGAEIAIILGAWT